jgi:hypothetical protein
MITKEQAIRLGNGEIREEIHFNAILSCQKIVGSKGGIKVFIVKVRPNGKCQTWKLRQNEFRLPIKYGLYDYGAITHLNAANFHLASDCPIKN